MNHGGIKDKNIIDFSISVSPLIPNWIDKVFEDSKDNLNKYTYVEWIEEDFKKIFGKNSVILSGATESFHIIGHVIMKDSIVIIPTPNYTEYERIAKFNNNEIVKVDSLKFGGYTEEFYDYLLKYIIKIREKTNKKIIFITGNPNNPTGQFVRLAEFTKKLLEYDILIIYDEAFIDFSEDNPEIIDETIQIRTFTKSFGIPGIRVGYVISSKYTEEFLKYRQPWNIGVLGYSFLENLLKNDFLNDLKKMRIYIKKEINKFKEYMSYCTQTNYFTIKTDPKKFLEKSKKYGIYVRDTSDMGLNNHVRIGIKNNKDNEFLLNFLRKELKK
ncbi:aminotransferase class I/II-fold pyridoxal phosphate-dependent enzyme [Marinitoga sp. 38H-ov]|uniref:aminotransferase class I/II-fold pyridoxal phosphate-dependent enzyme n=1 Tax=Marinitoga sp. 38H-ov TaxID=1755814 RepID=UPI0013ECAA36|nr:aminotransferase class I/II-fold pyridoxal phosphate-dependent enzyme [Marinitoga sp. 38H-ov]KAF2956982.1 hypothetical protein AS160_03070 [Marinitoga sp. 38H-ov]